MVTNTIEYSRSYYTKNKEKIKAKMQEKVECSICGCIITSSHMVRHQKSNKCKIFIKN